MKPTSIEQLLTNEALSSLKAISSVNVITGNIGYGTTNSPVGKKKTPGTPGTPVAKVLLGEKPSLEERSKLNLGAITDIITEPQLEKTPVRSAFLITGIDVLNPAVEKTNHPNYEFGPKGKVIGVLEQPQSMVELFPSAYNNVVLGQAQEEAGVRKKRTDKSRLTQVVPVQMGLVNKEFTGTKYGLDNTGRLIDFMNRSFPFVNISTDQNTIDRLLESPDVTAYLKEGAVVYGMTKDGNIFINSQVHNSESELFNTAIHEMGHVWTKHLQLTPKGKKIYKRGAELVQQTKLYERLLKRFDGDVDRATEEAMATLIGNRGESVVNASLKQKIKDWIAAVWDYVRQEFKLSKDLTTKEIQNLTMDEFLGTALADIFQGKEIKLSDKQLKDFTTELKQAMFRSEDTMEDIIRVGRDNGFSDASIREVLRGRGFKMADIKSAMEVSVDVFTQLPQEFSRVEGGIEQAVKLFNEVRAKLSRFANPERTLSDVRQKGMDLMKANAIFQAQPEQIQQELLVAFDRTIGIRQNANVRREIADIKKSLKSQRVGQDNLRNAQIKIKNFIRQSLPKSKTYSQAQINKLVNLITKTNLDNFQAQAEKVIEVVEQQRNKMKMSLIRDINKLVKQKSKAAITDAGKRRTRGLDAQGQSFFNAIAPILRGVSAKVELQVTKPNTKKATSLQKEIDKFNDAALNPSPTLNCLNLFIISSLF